MVVPYIIQIIIKIVEYQELRHRLCIVHSNNIISIRTNSQLKNIIPLYNIDGVCLNAETLNVWGLGKLFIAKIVISRKCLVTKADWKIKTKTRLL